MKKKVIKGNPLCKTCGGYTRGFRCDVCGAESLKHQDSSHGCGGKHCVAKCVECGEAETLCDCEPVGEAPRGKTSWHL